MKPAVWISCLTLVVALSVPFGAALVIATIAAPAAAHQLSMDSCGTVADAPGLPTPAPSRTPDDVTTDDVTTDLDCVPVSGDLPPGPEGTCPPSGGAAERGVRPNALRHSAASSNVSPGSSTWAALVPVRAATSLTTRADWRSTS